MKISRNWLQEYFTDPLPNAEALADALTFHAFEIDGIEKVGTDDVLDVKVTPNRGHDCLSHWGIAKELSAILKLSRSRDPLFNFSAEDGVMFGEGISVTVADPNVCKRYIAARITGVKVGPSSPWLKERLESIGQRSINNIVDATNFVMFNIGQPMHAFDIGKLESKNITVRSAREGERFVSLDNKEYALSSSNLVIANGEDAIGVAGVKGGKAAGITEDTKDILLESANFDGPSIRKTAQALKLRTDASARFEQVLSPGLALVGMHTVINMIRQLAGGETVGFVDVYPKPQEQKYASVTVEKINKVLGVALTGADVSDVFQRLGFAYKEEAGVFEVRVPFERLDIEIAEDLIEEVGRIIGYEKVPATPLPPFEKKPEINKSFYAAEKAREELVAQGYSEVYTSVFADKGDWVVLNKVDGVRPYLRDSLLPGLTEALAKNKNNKDLLGLTEVKLFEIGVVWKDGKEVTMLCTVSERSSATEKILDPVDSEKYDDLPLSAAVRFKPFSKYPYIVRDIAFWIPVRSAMLNTEEEILEMIKKEAGEMCLKVDLFDRFEKDAKVSLAYRLIFQSFERTLTEVEVQAVMEKVSTVLKSKGFEIR